MTNEEIAQECERLFQAGGPRVYSFYSERNVVRPSLWSATKALRYVEEGEQIWQRRKVRGAQRYEWVHVNKPNAPKQYSHGDDVAHALELAQRVARLNPDAGEIGAGMLRSLVELARKVYPQ